MYRQRTDQEANCTLHTTLHATKCSLAVMNTEGLSAVRSVPGIANWPRTCSWAKLLSDMGASAVLLLTPQLELVKVTFGRVRTKVCVQR